MLDIKWIRENPEALVEALTNRGSPPAEARRTVDEIISKDEARRSLIAQVQQWQELRNTLSKEIGVAKATNDERRVAELMEKVSRTKSDITNAGEKVEAKVTGELDDALALIPNIPLDDVPVGDETANKKYRDWGAKPALSGAKEHYELGEALGGMDFETATKLSGSRFVVLKGQLARVERALGQFMLDLHTTEHGYTEIQPPLLVRDDVAYGTGQLPKAADDMFETPLISEMEARRYASALLDFTDGEELAAVVQRAGSPAVLTAYQEYQRAQEPPTRKDAIDFWLTELARQLLAVQRKGASRLWLIPTAEVPLTNLVREQILDNLEQPLRYTALTPCFRSEAGAAGKDTRGMLRQHQFDKVELVSITTPEQSRDEHERMLVCAEEVLKRLDLHYRVMVLSTGDMGFAAQKTYDIEVWLPGQGAYREISSCSVCGDFQARRMNARYRPKGEKGTRFVHTLNGSGVAVGRALIAVMENYQNPDGTIAVPDALRRYVGGLEKIG
jgi:seryl-tRNA synthetase